MLFLNLILFYFVIIIFIASGAMNSEHRDRLVALYFNLGLNQKEILYEDAEGTCCCFYFFLYIFFIFLLRTHVIGIMNQYSAYHNTCMRRAL